MSLGRVAFLLIPQMSYWYSKLLFNSASTKKDHKRTLSRLMIDGHAIEKGLTMPEMRLGFGYELVRLMIKNCGDAIACGASDTVEVQSALNDLEQYYLLHEREKFDLPEDIADGIRALLKYKTMTASPCFETTSEDYFKTTRDFSEMAHQRHSVRWYSDEPVDQETLVKALQLAQTAPSACNRQSVKVHVIASEDKKKEVLKLQNGNRGFGDRADKILLVTSDLRYWAYDVGEMAYIDGGIFIMNLLYALHYYKINACTLNARMKISNRRKLAKIVGMEPSEIPVAFILVGRAPESFKIAGSQRLNVEDIVDFV